MFNLQFDKIHAFLFPRAYDEHTGLPLSGQGRPTYPLLNESSPRSGIHICRETVFTSGSLALICYAKNQFAASEDQKPIGVKVCLKITAGIKKKPGSYGSVSMPGETVSFECRHSDMVGIWRVLRGFQSGYSIYLPLPGQSPKSFDLKFQPGASDCYYAEAHESNTSVRVPFDEGAAFGFQAVIVAVTRVLYPHLDSAGAVLLLDECSVASTQTDQRIQVRNEKASTDPTFEPDLRAEGDEDIRPGIRKAIYAICMQTWPAQRKDVAQYIQKNAGQRVAQRIVDAANGGDFSELDSIAEYLDRND